MPANDFLQLLRRLTDAGVEYVIVGGTAAVLHGATTATYDLDVLMPFSPANCEGLLRAVADLHPRLSHTVDKRPLAASAVELASFHNLYLLTDLGRLDVLGSLPPLTDVGAVFDAAEELEVGGVLVKVLSLGHLIAVKASMDRPKDKLVEAELRAIAAVKTKRDA